MSWKEKFISKAGREILIKIIAQAIPTYSMSLSKIPKVVGDSINSTLAKYWVTLLYCLKLTCLCMVIL